MNLYLLLEQRFCGLEYVTLEFHMEACYMTRCTDVARILSGGALFSPKADYLFLVVASRTTNSISKSPQHSKTMSQKLTLAPPGGALGVLGRCTYKFSL